MRVRLILYFLKEGTSNVVTITHILSDMTGMTQGAIDVVALIYTSCFGL